MKFIYEFRGGKYNGQRMSRSEVMKIFNGNYRRDWSLERRAGELVPRAELDNQPLVNGYLAPMYDGERYIVNGTKYDAFDYERLSDETKTSCKDLIEIIGVIRYETQGVYNSLSC